MTLVLFESAAGYALFKVSDKGDIEKNIDDLHKKFATPKDAAKLYVVPRDLLARS